MAVYFFDTSALVKAYVSEVGTAWVQSLINPTAGNDIYILRVTEVEMTSALIRRRNTGSLSAATATGLLAHFRSDAAHEFIPIDVSQAVLTHANRLIEQHGLRAYDGIQLAAARELHSQRTGLALAPLTLVSADGELNSAAQAEGISVEDPNRHP